MGDEFTIFAGTADPDLAEAVAAGLGVQPGACSVERFPDGEVSVRLEESVRGRVGEILATDTVPVRVRDGPALRVATVAPLVASALRRLLSNESLGDLC